MKIVNLCDHAEHLATICGWHQQQWAHLNPSQTIEQRIASMEAHLLPNVLPLTLLAVDQEKVIGSACLALNDGLDYSTPNNSAWLISVYVESSNRQKGVASQLIEAVHSLARQHNYSQLYLYTEDQQCFYNKRGWRAVKQLQHQQKDITVMRYDLMV